MHPWLTEFQRDQIRRNLSERTIRSRRKTLVALFRRYNPETVSREEIEKWLDDCSLSARSRSTYIGSLRAFFVWANDVGRRHDNPMGSIGRPKLPRLIPRPISTSDLRVALENADARMKAWLMLGAFQGFRSIEIAGLLRQDIIDTADPPIIVVSHAKGARERVLPLNPATEEALWFAGLPRTGPVFRLRNGRPLIADRVSTYVNRYFRGLHIAATCHQLRHWFGTRLYAETRDIRVVQEMLGHVDPQTTAGYAAFSPGVATDAVRRLTLEGPKRTRLPSLFDGL